MYLNRSVKTKCAENKKEITTQYMPYICPKKPELKLFSPVSEKIL